MTSFPPIKGHRSGLSDDGLVVKTCRSKLSLASLQQFARRDDTTPAAILQASWARLLRIYTGTADDIAFGCVLPRKDAADGIEPIRRVTCPYGPQRRKAILHTVPNDQHEASPTNPESNKYQPSDDTLLNLDQLLVSDQSLHASDDRFRYSVICIKALRTENGALSLGISGPSTLIDEDAAQLLLQQFDHILNAYSADPSCQLEDTYYTHFPASLLSISNPDPVELSSVSTLQSQFESIAKSAPDRVALEFWTHQRSQPLQREETWTYAELNHKADITAAELERHLGSVVGQVVPICMQRCPNLYVAVLGILKAGGAWCPIDPSFPSQRRHDLIARAGAKAVIIDSQSPRDRIPEGVRTINISEVNWHSPIYAKQVTIDPDDLAYLIWTSGTTGQAKGVPVSHRAAIATMRSLQASIPTTTSGGAVCCVQFSQFTFDVFVQDLFYTWGVGGTLISADRATMLASFPELATKAGATHAHLTPAFAANTPRETCPTLEIVTMIGEKLTQGVADDWSKGCQLFNTYGPAEATVVATLRRVPHGDTMQSANIGLPLPSVSAFVMQKDRVALKNGIGELALSGPQLTKGYWNDQKRTEESFVWNEHLRRTLYRTGDTVRQLHNGTLEFIGRADDLIKIQGIRVELSEIAFALHSCHPQVRQIEVLFLERPDRPSRVIVAFFAVPALPFSNTTDEHAIQVAQKGLEVAKTLLPDYMVPKVLLAVKTIPMTPSAKVDRTALAKIYADVDLRLWESKMGSSGSGDPSKKKLDSNEIRITDTIAALTGTSSSAMSRQSALPSIGVDSITATRLAANLNQEGIEMSVMDILHCATLEDLFISSRQQHDKAVRMMFDLSRFHDMYIGLLDSDLVVRAELVMPVLPLQEAMLSESFQNPDSYWAHKLFELDPGIDLRRLEKAWSLITQSTDALRTVFFPAAGLLGDPQIDTSFVQVLLKRVPVESTMVSTTEDGLKTAIMAQANYIAKRCQESLFAVPSWAITVFSMKSRIVMMFSIHHAIRDEPSLDMIMADLKVAYTINTASPLPHRHQLRDAVSLLYPADAGRAQADQEFWESRLERFQNSKSWPELKLADEGRRPGTTTHIWVAETSYSEMRTKATGIGAASLAAVFRIIWGFILLEYLETDNVVFGETWSARSEASALGDIIGPLLFVLPTPFRARGTCKEMLQRQEDIQKQSKTHYGIHPSRLRRILRRAEGESLYPAIFNFVPAATDHREDHFLWQELGDAVEPSVEHAIAFNVFVSNDDKLEFQLIALKSLTDQAHLRVLAQQIDALLLHVLDNPDRQSGQISHQMPRDLLSFTPMHETGVVNHAWTQRPTRWVDHYTSMHPDWNAAEVVSSFNKDQVVSEHWSYRELQRAYRNVATVIIDHGCRKRAIAVCLDRRLVSYAIVLAIMDTGNVYLPIADDLPEQRRTFLLRDSDAALLFTTKSWGSSLSSFCPTKFLEDMDLLGPVKNYVKYNEAEPTDNAYLLYTSGSTGVPKGVLVSRGNLMSFIEAISHFIGSRVDMPSLQGKGKWLGMASYAFDVHLLEMFFPWRHGMATATASRSILLDNLELALGKLEITHASFVPSLVDNAGLDPANLPTLRYMSLGGEKISKKAINTWSRSHVVLANAYGPTEATIGCCFRRVEPTTNVRNIGYPLPYTEVHVFCPGTTEYALRGVSGELCLTGDLVANGYHKRPDAKGFVENSQGRRMYRTGDRVRMMADGSLEFLGRDDDQTKIRGQRIELAEVSEAVRLAVNQSATACMVEVVSLVLQHPVLTRPQLVAFITTNVRFAEAIKIITFPGYEVLKAIRQYCRNVLPSFMVPDQFIRLTSLPRVPTSRKVDTKQLKLMFDEISLDDLVSFDNPALSHTSTLNEAETTIRRLVGEVLGVEEVTLKKESNLFRFGLDSLGVITLSIKLSKLGHGCSITGILKNPTIQAIAALPIRRKKGYPTGRASNLDARFRARPTTGFNDGTIEMILSCLPLQETLVATSIARESEAFYVNHVLLELSPHVDHQKLIQAWISTANDHQILRTYFREFENNWIQVVLKDALLSVDRFCSESARTDLRQREADIASDIVKTIEVSPPIRLTLAAPIHDGRKGFLLVSLHHALYDLDSFTMILDEVYTRYQGTASELAARTPVKALIDHIGLQDEEEAKSFWTAYLADYVSPSLVDLTPDSSPYRLLSKELDVSLTNLEALAALLNCTPALVMQALFGIALAELTGVNDLVFGAVLSGRTVSVENANSILAPCITTIPQRVQIPTGESLHYLIQSAQKGFVESVEYQHTALRSIHRWVEAKSPLFDTLFTYTPKREERPWAHLWHEVESSMVTEFGLAMEVVADQSVNGIMCRCEGTSEKAQALLDRLNGLVKSLAEGTDVTVGEDSTRLRQARSSSMANVHQWTKTELILKDIVTNIGEVASGTITSDTSFFALGIDSITAIQFVRRIRKAGYQCTSAEVMRYSCISKLAEHITMPENVNASAEDGCDLHTAKQDLNMKDVENVYPCTPLQSSMLTQTLGSDTSVYTHHHVVRFPFEEDRVKLKDAWADLVAGTEILRTSFHFYEKTSTWVGAVSKSSPALDQSSMRWIEYQHDKVIGYALAKAKENFVFKSLLDFGDPPWRVALADNGLVLSMHHSLYDEETVQRIFYELWALSRGYALPNRPHFSQAANMMYRNRKEAANFWIRTLADFEGNPRNPSIMEFHETRAELSIDVDTALESCRSMGVTLQSVALLAIGKTLAGHCKQHDIVFGHVVRGRTLSIPGIDDVIGPLFNTVPVRVNLNQARAMTNRDTVRSLQHMTGESQAHQHASLQEVQNAWRKEIEDAEAELFDTLFVFQKRGDTGYEVPWDSVDVEDGGAPTEYRTNFECEQTDIGINVCVNSRSMVDLDAFIRNFEQALVDVLQYPKNPAANGLGDPAISNDHVEGKPQDETVGEANTNTIITVRRLLAKVSGINEKNITEDASIFSLGLDSISAIEIASAARKQSLTLSVADVLQGRTVRGICQRLNEGKSQAEEKNISVDQRSQRSLAPRISKEARSTALEIAGIRDDDVDEVLSCFPGQHYHLMTWLKSGRTLGEGTFTYRSNAVLDIERLLAAWHQLRKSHTMLRTTCVSTQSQEAMQIILRSEAIRSDAFQIIDLTSDGAITPAIQQIASRRFDMFSPPAELCLVHSHDGKDFVVLKLHHALYDARTVGRLVNDLVTLYNMEFPATPASGEIIQRTLRPKRNGEARDYWQQSLRGFEQTIMTSRAKVEAQSGTKPFSFTKSTIPNLHRLEERCRQHDTTLPTIILAAFARTLARYTTTANPVFGLYQSGNSNLPQDTMTPTLNVTPLVLCNISNKNMKTSIEELLADLAARVPYEQCYLRDILEWVGWSNERPLFNTWVNILWNSNTPPATLSGVSPGGTPATEKDDGGDLILTPSHPENVEDIPPRTRLPGRTAVDGLDTYILADGNMYLDAQRCAESDSLQLIMRCDYGVMSEKEAEEFFETIRREINTCFELEGAEEGVGTIIDIQH
ncbi:MAG: hypothetical protein Q9218_005870 [Villophora microphyllina]